MANDPAVVECNDRKFQFLANDPAKSVFSKKLIQRKTRRGGIRHRYGKYVGFSILGNNVAGINGKRDSLEALIKLLKKPSCITLQESKLGAKVKFELQDYKVYQRNRNSSGGGLITAVDLQLDSVHISAEDIDAEILVVQIVVNKLKIRVINAYGPQDDDPISEKIQFWTTLEKEILAAKGENCEIIIQMDANAKVGERILPGNPHKVPDTNGLELIALLDRQNLALLNADNRCNGSITRYRETVRGIEKSILDYMLVSESLYQSFQYMKIDEDRLFTVMKYASKTGKTKQVVSDHNPLIARFDIKYKKIRSMPKRIELFNLKNIENQQKFFKATNSSPGFLNCSKEGDTLENQCKSFNKAFNKALHSCFSKVRVPIGQNRTSVSESNSEVCSLIKEKTRLLQLCSTITCSQSQSLMKEKIDWLQNQISEAVANRNAKAISDYVSKIENTEGKFCQTSMWKVKNRLFVPLTDPQMAKRDETGALITSPLALKRLYLKTYTDRLKNREMMQDLLDLYKGHY